MWWLRFIESMTVVDKLDEELETLLDDAVDNGPGCGCTYPEMINRINLGVVT